MFYRFYIQKPQPIHPTPHQSRFFYLPIISAQQKPRYNSQNRQRYLINLCPLPKYSQMSDSIEPSFGFILNCRAYFVFSQLLHINIMNGKDEQKIDYSAVAIKCVKDTYPIQVKHSIASTAVSGSAANSVVLSREQTQRKMEESQKGASLAIIDSSSSIFETADRVFEQLSKKNKKSHLLKKYGQLKEKYGKIMENSRNQLESLNRKKQFKKDNEEKVIVQFPQAKINQNISQNTLFSSADHFSKAQHSNCIQFWSQNRVQIFHILKYLNEGACGKVYLVQHQATGCIFSLKIIPKMKIGDLGVNQLIRELKIQSYLEHPNIVKLYHYHIDQENVYLLLEPCLSKDLYQTLKYEEEVSEKKVKNFTRQVCQAVQYMHKKNIIHRDIKPQNILLHEDVVKLCDFGWAVHSPLMRGTRCGTPLYASPEMVREEEYDSKIDIWNIGVLTYELLYGNIPFEIRQLNDLYKIIEQEVYFSSKVDTSHFAKEFIDRCLQKQPHKRFTIRQAIEHQFLSKIQKYRWTIV